HRVVGLRQHCPELEVQRSELGLHRFGSYLQVLREDAGPAARCQPSARTVIRYPVRLQAAMREAARDIGMHRLERRSDPFNRLGHATNMRKAARTGYRNTVRLEPEPVPTPDHDCAALVNVQEL